METRKNTTQKVIHSTKTMVTVYNRLELGQGCDKNANNKYPFKL